MAGQSIGPVAATSTTVTTTGGAGNHDTVTFESDGDYIEVVNLGPVRVSVLIDSADDPTIDGDGTITVPSGSSLLERSRARQGSVVKLISSLPSTVALRVVEG